MRVLIDMNLSPEWVPVLVEQGFDAVHWSSLGAANAPDFEIIDYAFQHRCVVFTHDLDFGIILAHSKAGGPREDLIIFQDVSSMNCKGPKGTINHPAGACMFLF